MWEHAAARILQRPWLADPDISEVISSFVTGKRSVAQVIENSDCFATWFKNHIDEMEVNWGKRVHNLKAAKHRFESLSKPLARIVLFLPAVCQTIHDIAARREEQPVGKWAKAWLNQVTGKDFILLGMLADAADESMAVVRLADDESPAQLSATHGCSRLQLQSVSHVGCLI